MNKRPSDESVESAIQTILSWLGEDVNRTGILDTPKRLMKVYRNHFSGYLDDPRAPLMRTFEDLSDYHEIVLTKQIRFVSHCEHHMAPMPGIAHIAYVPHKKVVGLSKLARVLDIYARRLQSQERLTKEVATTIHEVLDPLGVAVILEAEHQCMTMRGVAKPEALTVTQYFTGVFRSDQTSGMRCQYQDQLYALLNRR